MVIKERKKIISNIVMLLLGVVIGCIISTIVINVNLNKRDKLTGKSSGQVENVQNELVQSTVEQMLEEDGIKIKTPFVDLYYPEKWEQQIRIEQIEGDIHSVNFWGTVEGKSEVKLFEIAFGHVEGIFLGTLDEKEVYLIYSDIVFDESWNEEEQDEIFAMQEDVNYILGMLKKEKGFDSNTGER